MAIPDYGFNIIGGLGAALLLFGFYRTSIGKWKNRSFLYELDNLLGAGLLSAYTLHLHAYISVVVNIVWGIVAFRGITSFAERYFENGQHPKKRRTRKKRR